MRRVVVVPLLLVAASSAAAEDLSLDLAREAEERAFVAIDEGRWCAAAFAFVDAHEHRPSVDFLLNGARAAVRGDDLALALDLYARAEREPGALARVDELRAQREKLGARVASEGAGTACLRPEPPAPAVTTTTTERQPEVEVPAHSTPATTTEPLPVAPTVEPVAAAEAARPEPLVDGDADVVEEQAPLPVLLAGGATALVAGVGAALGLGAFGAYEYFLVFHDREAAPSDRYLAQTLTPFLLAGAAAGGVLAVGGGGLVAWSVTSE